MPKSERLAWVGRLPAPLAWVAWAVMAVIYLLGALVGTVASDLYGYLRRG